MEQTCHTHSHRSQNTFLSVLSNVYFSVGAILSLVYTEWGLSFQHLGIFIWCLTYEYAPPDFPLKNFVLIKNTSNTIVKWIFFRWSNLFTILCTVRFNIFLYYRWYTVNTRAKSCAIPLVNLEFLKLFVQLGPMRMCFLSLLHFWLKMKYNHPPADNVPSPLKRGGGG